MLNVLRLVLKWADEKLFSKSRKTRRKCDRIYPIYNSYVVLTRARTLAGQPDKKT
jgi:hypothetical protein